MNDTLFTIQSELIKKYADAGSCVIVGRCADKVLEKRDGLISVFIYAPLKNRVEEIMRRFETDEEEALYLVRQADKIRRNYYNYYAKKKWGDRSSYDLMIDSSHFTDREVAAMIRAVAEERKAVWEEDKFFSPGN